MIFEFGFMCRGEIRWYLIIFIVLVVLVILVVVVPDFSRGRSQ